MAAGGLIPGVTARIHLNRTTSIFVHTAPDWESDTKSHTSPTGSKCRVDDELQLNRAANGPPPENTPKPSSPRSVSDEFRANGRVR